MVITYYGVSCFKIQSGDTILAFDPPSKKAGLKTPRFQADVVFVSHEHESNNGFENITPRGENGEIFLINNPGEYEIKGISVRGIPSFHDSKMGKEWGLNTVYVLSLENVNICHLGDFGEGKPRPEFLEFLGDIDILFTPIGNGDVTSRENMAKLINQIGPKIIIPMRYNRDDFKVDEKKLSSFLKEIGQEKVTPVEKFTFRKKDIAEKKGEVVVLSV